MEYNQYDIEQIKDFIKIGKKAHEEGLSMEHVIYEYADSPDEAMFVGFGYDYPDFEPVIKEYYRISEPEISYGAYKNSYNHAEDRPEEGVSVVTKKWLNSLKSVFFGTTDDDLKAKGVYKIKGFELPCAGGDDEILICPMDWAEKTRIRTKEGLRKAVKKANKKG